MKGDCMAKEIKVPDFGVNTDSVVIVQWLVEVGQNVKRGDVICEVETDKAVTDLESVAQGVLLKQVAQVKQTVVTGEVIAYIGVAGENIE